MFRHKTEVNLIIFIALMGTSALALCSKLIFHSGWTNVFAYILEAGVFLLFVVYFFHFFIHLFNWSGLLANLRNPAKANLYSAMPIAAALVSLMLTVIGLPGFARLNLWLSVIFWAVSLFFSAIFLVVVPISLKFRSRVEHISGTWFLPPVGIFVLIIAGSTLALKVDFLASFMIFLNLFLFGPAFILYFLTLSLLYFRSKFYELAEGKLAPTFNILLAPVAVSILALIATAKLWGKYNFFSLGNLFIGLAKIYSLVMFGYGLWVLFGLSLLYYRIIKEKGIPFSELWWAFVFPVGAFTLATANIYNFVGHFLFFKVLSYILYFTLFILWLYVFVKQLIVINKK